MNLNQLIYFRKVCDLKSISRAAEQLHISQPSVTNALKNLEFELGVNLLNRKNKKILITNEGTFFLNRVNTVLNEIDDAILEMNDYSENRKETIKIGVPPMICTFLFPEIFHDFHKANSKIELKAFEHGSEDIKEMLKKNDLDLGIIISDTTDYLDSNLILRTEIHACINKSNKLSNLKEISFEDLKKEPIIMLKRGFYHHKSIMQHFDNNNIVPNIIFHSDQIATIKGFIDKNIGMSLLLKEMVFEDENIIHIPLEYPLKADIRLVWRKNRYLSKAVRSFIDFIDENKINYGRPNQL